MQIGGLAEWCPWVPHFRYSFEGFDPLLHVRASGREVGVSPKAAREVCTSIKGLILSDAKKLLEDVIDLKKPIAFRRYKKKAAHRRSLTNFHAGAYPAKAARKILDVVNNLEANADFKGMDSERLKIVHAAALRGRQVKAFTSRAFGRSSPSFNTLVHIELIAREV